MAVAPSPWISGPRFDLGLLMGPALLACAVAWALPAGWTLPAWGWLLAIVGIDVAHVYASIYRTVLDPVAWRARKTVFVGIGSTVAIGLLCLWWMLGEVGFWRVLAYLAVFHFVRQVWGFAALYRLREGLGTRGLDATVERWALYALTGWPLLWWHVHGPLAFAWFIPEDFFVGLPAWTLWPAGVLGGAVILAHLVFRLRSRRAAWGRDLWMLTTGVVWIGGIVLFGGDGAFSLTNVVAHGVPYVALVLLDVKVRGRHYLPQICVLSATAAGLLSMSSYFHNILLLYGISGFVPAVPDTATAFLILCFGVLCARPQREPVAIQASSTAGGGEEPERRVACRAVGAARQPGVGRRALRLRRGVRRQGGE